MRIALALVPLLLLAGCTDSTDNNDDMIAPDDPVDATNMTLPEDIHTSGMIVHANPVQCGPGDCVEIPFTVPSNGTHVDATLTWVNPADDLYLSLWRGETLIAESNAGPGSNPGSTAEHVDEDLDEGSYSFVFWGWVANGAEYEFDVAFSWA